MKRLVKSASYNFSFDILNKVIDSMGWQGNGDSNAGTVEFIGKIKIDELKSQFEMTDEDIQALPGAVKNGELDFDTVIDDLFSDYIQHPQNVDTDEYTLQEKEINVNVLNGEFYIEGSAIVDYEASDDMNGPTDFNQNDFI